MHSSKFVCWSWCFTPQSTIIVMSVRSMAKQCQNKKCLTQRHNTEAPVRLKPGAHDLKLNMYHWTPAIHIHSYNPWMDSNQCLCSSKIKSVWLDFKSDSDVMFYYKVIRDLKSIGDLCINRILVFLIFFFLKNPQGFSPILKCGEKTRRVSKKTQGFRKTRQGF